MNLRTISLQCCWIKKLYDASLHKWKIIPLTLIKNAFEECFIFHSNLEFNVSVNSLPELPISSIMEKHFPMPTGSCM